ncbi:MAG: CRISPR-associated endonuclease Cas2 [Chitinophagaceae bacterium]|nr:CRISPR-associated endonuclease Cas2 [Chitinophagaceae bacterium]
MPKPPRKEFDLKAKIERLKKAGFNFYSGEDGFNRADGGKMEMEPFSERIRLILKVIQDKPKKSTMMNYLILYDIEKDKVRGLIAKYLLSRGCIRIQKSVFLAHTDNQKFEEIKNTLAEINEIYQNEDSIILVPLNVSDARSMKLIGQNVNINQIIDPPNTVFL